MKFILVLSVFLTACATISPVGAEKDGRPLYETTCKRSTADCHKLASKQCAGAYDVVDQSAFLGDFHMTIACRGPASAQPSKQ